MSVLYKILAVVLAVFVFSPSGEVASYAPPAQEKMQFSFTVLSDGHMEGNSAEKHTLYGEGFRDMASAEVQSRALVMLGDNTMNGQVIENAILYGLMRKYNAIDTVLMAVGNHDICPGKHNQGDYDKLRERFIRFNNTFLENQIDALYYARVIEGCYFIVLASDCDAGVAQYISPEQFEWLDGVLQEAEKSGKPVFLFSHWPLNHVFSEVWQEGRVGEQSDELHALLQKYDNRIFFFTGHLHMGLREDGYGVFEEGQITYINVPSFGSENTNGNADVQDTGMGLQTEVYADKVVVRVRNFAAHIWTAYTYSFSY